MAECGGSLAVGRESRISLRSIRAARSLTRSSLYGSGGNAGEGSAAPGPKSPRWSAERRARPAGRAPRLDWHGGRAPQRATTENLRLSALRSPLMGRMEKRQAKPGRSNAAGTKKTALFDMVNRNIAATHSALVERV